MTHIFPYLWNIKDGYPAKGIPAHGLKVFGTFICGGGSSMGYKLAGYDHLGGVEIDKAVAEIYRTNHHPKHLFVEDLRIFNERTDLPDDLYNLDVLDGSPPCTTFSMAGQREKTWGKEKVFAEGQAKQTLDDLVFVYCNTIAKLRPKVFLLENVKGLALGNAKSYLRRVVETLRKTGYTCQVFILNGASMGVPQKRERCFVIGHRSELNYPKLDLSFSEPFIPFGTIIDRTDKSNTLSPEETQAYSQWQKGDRTLADTKKRIFGKNTCFTCPWVVEDDVCPTLTTGYALLTSIPRKMNCVEMLRASTFPQDYDYPNENRLRFLTGMSVPPLMIAQIANQIRIQWLTR